MTWSQTHQLLNFTWLISALTSLCKAPFLIMLSTRKKLLHKAYIHVLTMILIVKCLIAWHHFSFFFSKQSKRSTCALRERNFMLVRNEQHKKSYSCTRQYDTSILSLSKFTMLYKLPLAMCTELTVIKVITPSLLAKALFHLGQGAFSRRLYTPL